MARPSGVPKIPSGASTPTLWDEPRDPTWSVPELGEAIGLRMRTAFPDELWVRGVIRNLNPGRRGGTVWFDLVEPAAAGDLGRPPAASLSVVLFDTARRRVNARLLDAGAAAREGHLVRPGRPAAAPDVRHRPGLHARPAGRRPRPPAARARRRGPAHPAGEPGSAGPAAAARARHQPGQCGRARRARRAAA